MKCFRENCKDKIRWHRLTRTLVKRPLADVALVQSIRLSMLIPTLTTFTTYVLYRLPSKFRWTKKKNHFSLAVLRISPKNRIQPAVKVQKDGETR